MPLSLFGNKFSPKKTPPRRAHSLSNLHLDASQSREEFGPDVGPVKLKLGGSEIQFDNGMWVAGKKKNENFEITNIFTISKMFVFDEFFPRFLHIQYWCIWLLRNIFDIAESGAGGASHKEVMKLRKQNQLLSEENNLLKLKIDVLLDMVGQTCPQIETPGYRNLFYFWTIGSHSQWMDLNKITFPYIANSKLYLLSIFLAKLCIKMRLYKRIIRKLLVIVMIIQLLVYRSWCIMIID